MGTQCGGFQFLLILDLWGISFHAVVVFGVGKNLLFESILGHCENLGSYCPNIYTVLPSPWSHWNVLSTRDFRPAEAEPRPPVSGLWLG